MDAIALLCADHRKLERHFSTFRSILATGGQQLEPRRQLVRDLARDIAAHAEVEATGIYPLLRETAPATAAQVDRALAQHQGIAALIHDIEEARPTSNDFDAKMVVLFERLRDHFAEEEHELYPSLREHLGIEGLRKLADRLRETTPSAAS